MSDDYEPDPSGKSLVTPQLEYDVDGAGGRQLVVVQSPTLDDVVSALDALDQRSRTAMTLIDGTGAFISVGGGIGRYHVYIAAFDHDDRAVLQAPDVSDTPVEIVNDGQAHRYAQSDIVDRTLALAALKEFCHSGRPDLSLTWRTG
ncbi:Imm1 family immunity protein [Asanoa sp. NPDC049518]|uniref:Imm1 family immunity protein n=1 Tax=unclassified Asanoa TaxID=2685164 RepID=UPI00343F9A0E